MILCRRHFVMPRLEGPGEARPGAKPLGLRFLALGAGPAGALVRIPPRPRSAACLSESDRGLLSD